jgi:hypothetical protein
VPRSTPARSPVGSCSKDTPCPTSPVNATVRPAADAGAAFGVAGWLLVGMYLQRRNHARRARDAGRAVYFEVGANHLTIFTALEYGTFGALGRSTFDALLPQLATWLPAAELQALALAYLGHGAYAQVAREPDLPAAARKMALGALAETHRVAVDLLQRRVFTPQEVASLTKFATAPNARLTETANPPATGAPSPVPEERRWRRPARSEATARSSMRC